MSEEQARPEVEPQDPTKENENPVENPSQPENQQVNEEEPTQEKRPEEEENEETLEKNKSETQNITSTKDEDLFAGPYERLIEIQIIQIQKYYQQKILIQK